MSGYSFSHQFYQRWMQAPDQVRGAIVQELKDIMTLLRTETAVSEFAFTQPDLDSHLDQLYAKDKAQKRVAAEKEQAEQEKERLRQEILEKQRLNRERLEKEQVEKAQAEKQRLEKQRVDREQAEQQRIEEAQAKKAEQLKQVQDKEKQRLEKVKTDEQKQAAQKRVETAQDNKNNAATLTITTKNANPSDKKAEQVKADNIKLNSELEPKEPCGGSVALSEDQEAFVHELETRIDDYLSEQMAKMSEDLKAWLRDEVQRQLARSK